MHPLLRLDGVEFPDNAGSRQVAGVAVSGLDVLARQRSRTATGSTSIETPAVFALWRCFACRVARAGKSCHPLSGQWMMSRCLASGAASAHRYNLASLILIFKTRMRPCGIAVRAAIEKLLNSNEKRLSFGANCTSLIAAQRRIRSFDLVTPRFPDDCQLKTAASQRSCNLRFPYGTNRRHSNGLLEQMP